MDPMPLATSASVQVGRRVAKQAGWKDAWWYLAAV